MDDQVERTLSILAAFLVLLTATLDPWVSAGLALLFLVALSIYTVAHHRRLTK